MERLLVTGCSGFIGMHLCKSLLEDGHSVFGIDNMNNFYDTSLKRARLKILSNYENFSFRKVDIIHSIDLQKVFDEFQPQKVVNLAAQVGVRYSIKNPKVYISSNIVGFMNVIEACKNNKVKGLIYASSSSVYGGNKKIPFSTEDKVDKPISIYAATKKANELIAYSYSHLFGLNTTGLRFFTVYGPWGRPDMSIYIFSNKLSNNETLQIFNHGNMKRDFTYIDDIIDGIRASIKNNYPCEVFNLGNSHPEDLMIVVGLIEKEFRKKAKIEYMDMQPGDIEKTFANINHAEQKLNYSPKTSIQQGIPRFVNWYKSYKNYNT